jgi:hypothetical protein
MDTVQINYSNISPGVVIDPKLADNYENRSVDNLEGIVSVNQPYDPLLSVDNKVWYVKSMNDAILKTIVVDHISMNNRWLNEPTGTLTTL